MILLRCLTHITIWLLMSPVVHSQQIGSTTTYVTQKKESLESIAYKKKIGLDALYLANQQWDPDRLLSSGTRLTLPTAALVPVISKPIPDILVNLPEKRLYLFKPTVRNFVASVGRAGWSTPTGLYKVMEKKKDPIWIIPNSIREQQAALGNDLPQTMPPGKDNLLGSYMIRLSTPNYLIHGTNEILRPTIGQEQTGGCISLSNDDIAEVFQAAKVQDTVRIINQPVKVGGCQKNWCLEVYPDYVISPHDRNVPNDPDYQETELQRLHAIITYLNAVKATQIQEEKILDVLIAKQGIPQVVAKK